MHEHSQKKRAIYISIPGGESAQGGIVRQMLYYREAAARYTPEISLRFLQTRSTSGPWLLTYLRSVWQLVWALVRGKVTALHLNVSSNASFFRKYGLFLVARLFGCPVITHLHSGFFADFYAQSPALVQRMIRHLFRQSDKVLMLGRYWQEFAEHTLGVDAQKIIIRPNAVKGPENYVAKTPSHPLRMLFLAQLTPAKGVDDLIEALASPALRTREWELVLAGGGQVEHYRQKVQDAGLSGRITLPGWCGPREVEELLAKSDVMLLPSHVENQPLSVIEAMAYGLVVIATTVGTIPEMMIHQENGLLHPRKDIKALTENICFLLDNMDQMPTLKEAARASYLSDYQPENYSKALAVIYEEYS